MSIKWGALFDVVAVSSISTIAVVALVALGLVRGKGWRSGLLALVLFRLLDIWKPPPVRAAERV